MALHSTRTAAKTESGPCFLGNTRTHMQALLMTIVAATTSADPSFLREFAQTRRYLAGRPANVRLTPDGKTVLFLRAKPTSPEQTLFSFDVATGQTVELLTPESLLNGAAEKLSVEEKARLERMRVSARGFISFQLSPDADFLNPSDVDEQYK